MGRSYGQKDPLSEFRKEAFELFEDLLFKIKSETVKFLFNVSVVIEKQDVDENKMTQTIKKQKKYQEITMYMWVWKKYKHCHGRIV